MYRFQFHKLLGWGKLFSCMASSLNHYTASKVKAHTKSNVSATQRGLPVVDSRGIRSDSMEGRKEIIMLARITPLNPAENTDTHGRIIANHITKNHWDAILGANLYYKGVSLKTLRYICSAIVPSGWHINGLEVIIYSMISWVLGSDGCLGFLFKGPWGNYYCS